MQIRLKTRSTRRLSALWLLCGVVFWPATTPGPAEAWTPDDPPFEDVTDESGLDFEHFNGMSGEMYYPEIVGSGAALLDYDGDGDLDVYLIQGSLLGPGKSFEDALRPPPPALRPPTDRLYRNDLVVETDGRRTLRFVDVTKQAGLPPAAYGTGVAVGDVDNDGRPDLYVVAYGANRMLRNQGDGTFRDVTRSAGLQDEAWSAAASFSDFDADGDLDLFLVNYVEFSVAENPVCYAPSSRRDYCGPSSFPGVVDRLFRNRGDGTFEEVTGKLLRGLQPGPGLGVLADDLDGDGRMDFYVANDGAVNYLWIQQPDGTFRDDALLAGVAVNRQGKPEAGMGVASGDYDNDGDNDLFVTHLQQETNTLYVNGGGGLFEDRSGASGLGPPSLPFTAFGTGWIDVDNDGWLDVVTVNGAVRILETAAQEGDPFPLGQRNQLFRNLGPVRGDVRFEEITGPAAKPFSDERVTRGAAFGDLDNDGDLDVVLTNDAGPVQLLRNRLGQDRAWLGVRLLESHGRDALGARVEVRRADGSVLMRTSRTDGSFAAAHDPRVLFGLGANGGVVKSVRVTWPSGRVEEWTDLAQGRYTTLREGTGTPPGSEGQGDPETEEPAP